MNTKVIAIGNPIMSDEGIAIKVAENLKQSFKTNNIEVIIGETDVDYCIDNIKEDDFLFIVDATYYGIVPGSLTLIPLNKSIPYLTDSYSQHELSLINELKKNGNIPLGYIIGIEVDEIKFDPNLSVSLTKKFDKICSKVQHIIINNTLNS
jgi:hydrogenase maturation protease